MRLRLFAWNSRMITTIIKADCGCQFEDSPTGQVFKWCPLHKAASDMYKALKQAEDWFEKHNSSPTGLFAQQAIHKALAKANQ